MGLRKELFPFSLFAFPLNVVPLQSIFEKSPAIVGCTSALSELSALGLHHNCIWNRDVAQLVAHYVRDVGVGRSSRLIPTTQGCQSQELALQPLKTS